MPASKQTVSFPACSLSFVQQLASGDRRPVVVPLGQAESVSIQARDGGGATAWTTGVLTVRLANDADGPWAAVPAGSVTLTGAGLTAAISVSAYQFLAIDVTTAQSGSTADVFICLYSSK